MSLLFFAFRNGLLHAHDVEPEELRYLTASSIWWFYPSIILVTNLFFALVLSIIDICFINRIMHRASFFVLISVLVVMNIAILWFTLHFFDHLVHYVLTMVSGSDTIMVHSAELQVTAIFLGVTIIISRFLIEIDRKLGPGNLWKFLIGKLYEPREVQRIFMFIDLQGSTSIAERLGHVKMSQLIRDCFDDLSVVDKYCAEVYQYVGDEVVLSWSADKEKNFIQFIQAFHAFQDKLVQRKDHYESIYGFVPVFKAGAHAGPTVVTEVGQIKREINYHGDTLNTASRIQGKCNELDSLFLISESLRNSIPETEAYCFEDAGVIQLEGKAEVSRLFKVLR